MDDLRLGIGASRHTDYFKLSEHLDKTQLSYLVRTREFVDHEVLPVINGSTSWSTNSRVRTR